MKKVGFRVLAIALLAYTIGVGESAIGKMSSPEIFSIWNFLCVTFYLLLFMLVGYNAEKEAERNKGE